jgi:hypothetical protein
MREHTSKIASLTNGPVTDLAVGDEPSLGQVDGSSVPKQVYRFFLVKCRQKENTKDTYHTREKASLTINIGFSLLHIIINVTLGRYHTLFLY